MVNVAGLLIGVITLQGATIMAAPTAAKAAAPKPAAKPAAKPMPGMSKPGMMPGMNMGMGGMNMGMGMGMGMGMMGGGTSMVAKACMDGVCRLAKAGKQAYSIHQQAKEDAAAAPVAAEKREYLPDDHIARRSGNAAKKVAVVGNKAKGVAKALGANPMLAEACIDGVCRLAEAGVQAYQAKKEAQANIATAPPVGEKRSVQFIRRAGPRRVAAKTAVNKAAGQAKVAAKSAASNPMVVQSCIDGLCRMVEAGVQKYQAKQEAKAAAASPAERRNVQIFRRAGAKKLAPKPAPAKPAAAKRPPAKAKIQNAANKVKGIAQALGANPMVASACIDGVCRLAEAGVQGYQAKQDAKAQIAAAKASAQQSPPPDDAAPAPAPASPPPGAQKRSFQFIN